MVEMITAIVRPEEEEVEGITCKSLDPILNWLNKWTKDDIKLQNKWKSLSCQ